MTWCHSSGKKLVPPDMPFCALNSSDGIDGTIFPLCQQGQILPYVYMSGSEKGFLQSSWLISYAQTDGLVLIKAKGNKKIDMDSQAHTWEDEKISEPGGTVPSNNIHNQSFPTFHASLLTDLWVDSLAGHQ